ncbi:MAG TPA: hypothetical protein VL947_05575, partial [Cytophagales bacterium]|nr:hypothetical protein [Cytophagales bacterium]
MYKGSYYDRDLQQKSEATVRYTDYGLEITSHGTIVKVSFQSLYTAYLKGKHTLILKIGSEFPFSVLEVTDPQFVDTFYRRYPHVNVQKDNQRKGYLLLLSSILVCLGILVAFFALGIPRIGEYLATKIPKEVEVKIGEQYYT